jgi:putative transposase
MNAGQKNTSTNPFYFVTFNVVDWVDVFVRPLYKLVMVDALNHCVVENGLIINAWCLMSNHLHMVVQAKEGHHVPLMMRELKKYTTKKMFDAIAAEPDLRKDWILEKFEQFGQRFNKIEKCHLWQNCSNPVYIDASNTQMIHDHIIYIHENPVRDKIVSHPEDYIFSSARDYAGVKGLVKVHITPVPRKKNYNKDSFSGLMMN